MPDGVSEGEVENIIDQSLKVNSANLIKSLNGILARPSPSLVGLQIFIDVRLGFDDTPIDIYFNTDNSENETIISLVNIPYVELALHDKINFNYLQTEKIASWFRTCWKEAGGENLTVPVTIEHPEPGYYGPELLTKDITQ